MFPFKKTRLYMTNVSIVKSTVVVCGMIPPFKYLKSHGQQKARLRRAFLVDIYFHRW